MSYQDEPTALEGARLLGDLVQERLKSLELQHQGSYGDAGQVADDLLMRLSEWIPAVPTAELDISVAPLVLQGVALLADSSFLSIAAGDTAGAAERLRVLGQVTAEIGALADRVAGMGMLYCKDGRPSLDGSCLKIPPCTT